MSSKKWYILILVVMVCITFIIHHRNEFKQSIPTNQMSSIEKKRQNWSFHKNYYWMTDAIYTNKIHSSRNLIQIDSFIRNYLFKHSGERDSIHNLCGILFQNNYVKEAKPLLEDYLLQVTYSNETIDASPFQLLRNIYSKEEGGFDKYEYFIEHISDSFEFKPAILREASYYFESEGDLDRALRILAKGIENNPNDESLKFRLAEFYQNSGNLNAAAAEYQNAIALEETSQSYYALGKVYLALNDYKLAENSFHKALALNNDFKDEINIIKEVMNQ